MKVVKFALGYARDLWHKSVPFFLCLFGGGFMVLGSGENGAARIVAFFIAGAGYAWAIDMAAERAAARAQAEFARSFVGMVTDERHAEINVNHTYRADDATLDAWRAQRDRAEA